MSVDLAFANTIMGPASESAGCLVSVMPWRLVDQWNFTQMSKFESFLTHHMTQRNSGPDCAARLLAPRDLKRDEAGEAIVNAVIAMGMRLKQRVVAKGIETEQQLTFLQAHH